MIRIEPRRENLQLNMAPMIDMVFLLIIFFLTATTFTEREREQDVLLPETRNPGSLSRNLDNNIIVNVKRDGSLRVLGSLISHGELTELLRERKERAVRPLKVQVRGDRRTAFENVALALEAIERAGIEKPYVVTKIIDLEGS